MGITIEQLRFTGYSFIGFKTIFLILFSPGPVSGIRVGFRLESLKIQVPLFRPGFLPGSKLNFSPGRKFPARVARPFARALFSGDFYAINDFCFQKFITHSFGHWCDCMIPRRTGLLPGNSVLRL